MLVKGSAGAAGTTTGPEGLPWPTGDPEQFRVTAQQAAGLADELDRRRNELVTTGRNIDSWQGTAHAAYASDLERNAAAAESIAGSFRTVRDAVIDLARVMDQAQDVIRNQARRLGEAREQAQRASERAQKARAEAEAASRRAEAAAPAAAMSGGTDPATQEAQAAAESARSAEAEAAEARSDAQWWEQRATAMAEQEITDVRLMDGRCQALIGQAAQDIQAAVTKAGASAEGYNGLNSLGSFFTLFGPLGLTAFGLGAGGLKAAKASRWSYQTMKIARTAGVPWWRLPFARGNPASRLMPTFNNGFVGQKAIGLLPKSSRASQFLTKASRATPVFRGLGAAGSAVATVASGHRVVSKYGWNPVEAYEKGGASYVSGVAQTAFNASTTAFFVCPTPVTAGAMVVTGAAWAGTEIWEHHEAIWDGMKDAGEATWEGMKDAGDAITFWN